MAKPTIRESFAQRNMLSKRGLCPRSAAASRIRYVYDPRFWKSFTKKWMDQPVNGCNCRLAGILGLPLMYREIDAIVGAKVDALGFQKLTLKVRCIPDHATSADTSPGIHHSMPRHGIARFGHRVQCPADEDWTQSAVEEPRNLSVSRHRTSRDSFDDSIDALERVFGPGFGHRTRSIACRSLERPPASACRCNSRRVQFQTWAPGPGRPFTS